MKVRSFTLKRGAAGGFTLIEVLVGMAIVALLLALGLPSLSTYSANSKIRAAAANFSTDLQSARNEAIRTNGNVALILTSDAPVSGNAGTSNLSAAGPNWMLRSGAASSYTWVSGRTLAEAGATLALSGSVSSVNFTSLGGATDPAGVRLAVPASFDFSNPSAGLCVVAGGPVRCLRVQVTGGGQVRQCDLAVATAGDSRNCS
jgi:type IV fimbrial biogenesis protein FimT